jgi:catechol 2,3-dioxygenase-like lactoylglutathione lyase family enzyme
VSVGSVWPSRYIARRGGTLQAARIDANVEEVERAGGQLVEPGEHAAGAPYAYVRDPDGYLIEL